LAEHLHILRGGGKVALRGRLRLSERVCLIRVCTSKAGSERRVRIRLGLLCRQLRLCCLQAARELAGQADLPRRALLAVKLRREVR
jgi:hypothetical protein